MAFEPTERIYQYRMNQAPRTLGDGSGIVLFDIAAVWQEVGTAELEVWYEIPGYHQDFCVPAEDVEVVLSVPVGQAIAALKTALGDNLETKPVSVFGWATATIKERMDANEYSDAMCDQLNTLITTYKTYPFVFG